MNNQKRIYLGCPYSHYDQEKMEQRAIMATVMAGYYMKKYNYLVFSPITQGHEICKYGVDYQFETWKELDLSIIKNWANEFHYLPLEGYQNSKGLRQEFEYAKKLGLKIVKINEETIKALYKFLGYER